MSRTLSRKLISVNGMLLAGVAVAIGVCLVGVFSLRDTALHSVHEYEELRITEAAQRHTMNAKIAAMEGARPERVVGHLDRALHQLDTFRVYQLHEEDVDESHQDREESLEERARGLLIQSRDRLTTESDVAASVMETAIAPIDMALQDLSRLADETDVDAVEVAARRQARAAMIVVVVTLALMMLFCIGVSVGVYRVVMRPLEELRRGTRRIAAGRFDTRLTGERDDEFAELARDFNHMVEELDSLYQTLEERIHTRSRELVRSERLASVGFLAAGVAHEISTPLHIITGYAELSLQALSNANAQEEREETQKSLHIICEEAYRCKTIIQQLLSLARRSEDGKTVISLARVADDVVVMLSGMKRYTDKTIVLHMRCAGPFDVTGNEVELKQVLLNLVVNALDAVEDEGGEVRVTINRDGDRVDLSVDDNGCGMTNEVVEQVFEPFFTKKGNRSARGVGLGLSVSHAIIENHGGRLVASSEGPGLGSCFVIEMEAADEHLARSEFTHPDQSSPGADR